jgi:hypothetical protein
MEAIEKAKDLHNFDSDDGCNELSGVLRHLTPLQ